MPEICPGSIWAKTGNPNNSKIMVRMDFMEL